MPRLWLVRVYNRQKKIIIRGTKKERGLKEKQAGIRLLYIRDDNRPPMAIVRERVASQAEEKGGKMLIIIGGDAAGMSAASKVRRLQPEAEITVFERGPFTSFSA